MLMKKRFSFLITLLAFLAFWQNTNAAIVHGERILWSDLKAGDSILLRNANCSGTSQTYTVNGELMWLNMNHFVNGSWSTATTKMAMEEPNPFTLDYVAVLEEGPTTAEGNHTFYLKNAATGKYLAAENNAGDGSVHNYHVWLADTKAEATALEPTPVRDGHPEMPTTQRDDSTMELRHVDGNRIFYFGAAWNYGFVHYSTTASDVTLWNVYRVARDNSAKAQLEQFLSTTSGVESFPIGTAAGQYDETAISNFLEQKDIATDMLYDEHSDEEFQAQLDAIKAAYQAVLDSRVKVADGYYNFICGYTRYKELQDVDKAMAVGTQGSLIWAPKDSLSALQLFKVTALSDSTFSIQSVATGQYFAKSDSTRREAGVVMLSDQQEVPQTIRNIGTTDYFYIGNVFNIQTDANCYHTINHLSGRGITGDIVLSGEWGTNSGSSWRLEPITDPELISSLEAKSKSEFAAQSLDNAIAAAQLIRDKVYKLKPAVTSPSQFNSNNSSVGELSAFSHLIDGDVDYHSNFASTWNSALMGDASITEDAWRTAMEEQQAKGGENRGIGIGYHNLQVTLNQPLQKFLFKFIGRTNTGYVDNPADIAIYATNDDALGANPDNANQDQWKFVTEINKGFPGIVGGVTYTSPEIEMDQPYKYLRFVVLKSATMNRPGYVRTFAKPAITGVTWNVGEFNVYDGSADEQSQYFTVAGMKDAVDALDAAIDAVRAKIAAGTATTADTTEIADAARKVNSLYINRDSLYSVLQGLITEGYTAYERALPSKASLITNPNDQFSTNSMSAGDYGSFEHLVDGLVDYTHNFHSCWLAEMGGTDLTADSWASLLDQWLAGNSSRIAVGVGYHNLQVKFNEPRQSFWFEMTSRTGTGYTDTPNNIGIYVTNDDALGADPNQDNLSKWTEVRRLELTSEEMPDAQGVTYISPVFDLDQAYKYVRLVVYGTTHQSARAFGAPDITGITWNVGDLNFFTGADPALAQYNYDPDLHSAVDALKVLLDTDSALQAYQVQDTVEIGKIRAALATVQSLLVDTTYLHNLYSVMSETASRAEVGDEIGYVDSQEAIDTYTQAIDAAKASVSFTQPTVKAVDAAVSALKAAYDAFAPHVNAPAPNRWYNIISASTREYALEQPIFLDNTSVGAKLRVGSYTADKLEAVSEDPYAAWRLVPVEGKTNTYYIQSMGTGQYLGAYRGDNADLAPLMSHTPAEYNLWYDGGGAFRIRQASVTNVLDNLKADANYHIVLNYPANGDRQQAWKFQAVPDDQILTFNYFADNSLQILTLPWATKGENSISSLNGETFKTYAVKNATVGENGSTLELTAKEDFEAGEPMILVVGDYTQFDNFATLNPIIFNMPTEVTDTSAIVANGLVGTLEGFTLSKTGCGVIRSSEFYVNSANTFIDGRSGYIDPSRVVDDPNASVDLVLTTEGKLNDISTAKITTGGSDKVNVYTIDGTLVKRNVKATEATKGLNKGIYIIGKKKVLIK